MTERSKADLSEISLSTTFAQTAVGKPVGAYEYTRSSNPNRFVLMFPKAMHMLTDPKRQL